MTTDDSNQPLRLFIAFSIPEAVREAMIGAQQELREATNGDVVRWTKPDQIHLTLKFLGNIPVDRLEALKKAIDSVCAGMPVLQLRASGIGFFPNHHWPRVIWAGITDEQARLMDLQRQIAGAVRPFTTEQGGESFVGHLTLGRFRAGNRRDIRELLDRAQAMGQREFGRWQASEVEIFRSDLAPSGARHTLLAGFALKEN